jgi:hypothetical protein
MTKEEYSPEAQAVSDAANKAYWLWDEMCPADAHTIAVATLRAAYEQIVEDDNPTSKLLEIINELED